MLFPRSSYLAVKKPVRRLIVVLLAAGLFFGLLPLSQWYQRLNTRELTAVERAEITSFVSQRTTSPASPGIRKPDGTVDVFIGSPGELGGEILAVKKVQGEWRVVGSTLLF